MIIHIGADHGGFELKEAIKNFLENNYYEVQDHGAKKLDPTDDYPDYAYKVAKAVQEAGDDHAVGILLCRSGGGMAIAANKVKDIRAVQVFTKEEAEHGRKHDHANVMTIAGDEVDQDTAFEAVMAFLNTDFGEGRYERRTKQVDAIEDQECAEKKKQHPEIAVSLLSADFMHLEEELHSIESLVDRIHFDVMDGHFVENLALGLPLLNQLKTSLPIDAHLMIENPDEYAARFAEHCDAVYIHWLAGEEKVEKSIQLIRDFGKKPGITLNPEVQVDEIAHLLPLVSHVLIMSVHPGKGGQECLLYTLDKIEEIKNKHPEITISVDGGMNEETSTIAREKGADIIISGSYILKAEDREEAVRKLRGK